VSEAETTIEELLKKFTALPDVSDRLNKQAERLSKVKNSLIKEQSDAFKKSELTGEADNLRNWIQDIGKQNLEEELRLDPLIETTEKKLKVAKQKVVDTKGVYTLACSEVLRLQEAEQAAFCPTCLRVYDVDDPVDYASKINESKDRESAARGARDAAALAEGILQGELDRLLVEYPGEGHQELLDKADKDLASLKEQLLQYKDTPTLEAIEDMKQELAPLEQEVKDLNSVAVRKEELEEEVADWRRIKTDSKVALSETTTTLENLPEVDLDLAASADMLAKERTILNGYDHMLPYLQQQVNEAGTKVAVLSDRLEREEATKKQAKSLRKQLGSYKKLADYLRKSRARFLDSVWHSILSRATEIVSNATAGDEDQITEIARDKTGAFTYFEKGVELGMNDASGCQLEMLGISLRLSLTDLFYGHGSYMMLDEPSSQMSPENAAALAGVLAATGKQILYITHRSTEETTAQNIIKLGELS